MTKVLVAVASKHGSTAEIAETIGRALSKEDFEVTVEDVNKVESVKGFDAFVVGSGVYAGNWLAAGRKFIKHYDKQLAAKPIWLFSSGPIGEPLKPKEENSVEIGYIIDIVKPRGHRVFGGKLVKGNLNFAERAMITAVHATEGDFRNWSEITAWALGIARELKRGTS